MLLLFRRQSTGPYVPPVVSGALVSGRPDYSAARLAQTGGQRTAQLGTGRVVHAYASRPGRIANTKR
jgi:hypothetical protein